jgi:hypothetical protein
MTAFRNQPKRSACPCFLYFFRNLSCSFHGNSRKLTALHFYTVINNQTIPISKRNHDFFVKGWVNVAEPICLNPRNSRSPCFSSPSRDDASCAVHGTERSASSDRIRHTDDHGLARSEIDPLYFPLSELHSLAAQRLAEFSYANVHNVVTRSWAPYHVAKRSSVEL